MTIDRAALTDLSVHLRRAADAVSQTAQHLAVLSNGDSGSEEHWAGALDTLMAAATAMTAMDSTLGVLIDASRAPFNGAAASSAGKGALLRS